MLAFRSKHSNLVMHSRSQGIKAFCSTCQFWSKTAQQNVLVEISYLNMI